MARPRAGHGVSPVHVIGGGVVLAVSSFAPLALVLAKGAFGYQVIDGFAVMAALGLGAQRTLGSDVVGEFTTIVAPDFSEAFFRHWSSVTAFTIVARWSSHQCRLQPLLRHLAFEFHFFLVAQTPEPGHLDDRLMNEHILAAIIWCNKAPAFRNVKPFTPSSSAASCSSSSLHPLLSSSCRCLLQQQSCKSFTCFLFGCCCFLSTDHPTTPGHAAPAQLGLRRCFGCFCCFVVAAAAAASSFDSTNTNNKDDDDDVDDNNEQDDDDDDDDAPAVKTAFPGIHVPSNHLVVIMTSSWLRLRRWSHRSPADESSLPALLGLFFRTLLAASLKMEAKRYFLLLLFLSPRLLIFVPKPTRCCCYYYLVLLVGVDESMTRSEQ